MSTRYDKSIEISHEEEGTYRRREYSPARGPTTSYERYEVVPPRPSGALQKHSTEYTSDEDDEDKYEQWTTSKRKVNHKTRQVETRVSRQLLVEDGKVIADSGPQVTTRIKEDNKVEECEKEKAPKNKAKFDAIKNAPDGGDSVSGRVLGEKKKIQRVTHEVREENMQYHDERFKELTGHDVHRRAIKAPHELITINDEQSAPHKSAPRGKMVHYSNKGKTYRDTDEVLEVAKLAIDGSITKEVKRTNHHEEFSDTERPDEKGEAEALRRKPIAERSSRRGVDYVNDFDNVDGSGDSDSQQQHKSSAAHSKRRSGAKLGSARRSKHDEAFPRYEIDPLLNSLRDEDFKPTTTKRYGDDEPVRYAQIDHSAPARVRTHSPAVGRRSQSPLSGGARVEVPEEYRAHRRRLLSGNKAEQRERSYSPQHSKLSASSAARLPRKEAASTQANLTDEEDRKSSSSSDSDSTRARHQSAGGGQTHATHLQRNSNANSSRNYFYGQPEARKTNKSRQSVASISRSSSASSLDDPKEKVRRQGTRSRDSGFKSPTKSAGHKHDRQEIYSTSAKSPARRTGATSPTESLGQRSVKTTTTTMAAGLADRPLSPGDSVRSTSGMRRYETEPPQRPNRQQTKSDANAKNFYGDEAIERQSLDRVSLCSLNPNATTIKVPYKRVIEIEQRNDESDASSDAEQVARQKNRKHHPTSTNNSVIISSTSASESMSLQEDIVSLSKRLEQIRESSGPTSKSLATANGQQHFDYKTIIANVQPVMPVNQNQIVDSYSVQVIEHNSPFRNRVKRCSIEQVDDLSKSIAQKLQLVESGTRETPPSGVSGQSALNNNNDSAEINLNFNEYVKYKATPVLVDSELFNDDRASTCSLQSTRTYNIRTSETVNDGNDPTAAGEEEEAPQPQTGDGDEQLVLTSDESDAKRPAAWFYDPIDGSSTTIPAPVKPKRAETPKIDSKTEELAQSRGGRSYYLELVEPAKSANVAKRPRPNSIDSLYSTRWNSCNQLNTTPAQDRNATKRKQQVGAGCAQADEPQQQKSTNSQGAKETSAPAKTAQQQRRQLPSFDRLPPFGNRSKSSSCLLLPSTKSSKYSIFGGLRRPGEGTKPVPRLSYSRAIGPKSQRQIDAQPKTPSRYLKMR